MKKIIILFFLLLSLITLQAQDSTQSKTVHPVILKFGINEAIVDLYPYYEFFPMHGKQFHMFFTECNIPLNSFLAISPRVFGTFRIDRDGAFIYSTSAKGATIALSLKPIKWLDINAGIFYMDLMKNNGITRNGSSDNWYDFSQDEYTGLFTSFSSTLISTSKIQCGT